MTNLFIRWTSLGIFVTASMALYACNGELELAELDFHGSATSSHSTPSDGGSVDAPAPSDAAVADTHEATPGPRNRCGQLAPESDCNYCVCTGIANGAGCGNGAVGGDVGDFMANVTQSDVAQLFHPGPSTGWTCFAPSSIRNSGGPNACYCPHSCGFGGVGGDQFTLDLGISNEAVASSSRYGGATGWFCGRVR